MLLAAPSVASQTSPSPFPPSMPQSYRAMESPACALSPGVAPQDLTLSCDPPQHESLAVQGGRKIGCVTLCADTNSTLQAGTEGITQTIRAMVLSAVVQDGHAAQGLEVCSASLHPALTGMGVLRGDTFMTGDVHGLPSSQYMRAKPPEALECAGHIDRGCAGAGVWLLREGAEVYARLPAG